MTDTLIAPTPRLGLPGSSPPLGQNGVLSDSLTVESVAALGRTLEWGIDQRLQSTRATLRARVQDAVDRAARQADAIDPRGPRRRKVMDKLGLGREATADMLLLLVDEPDTYHDHDALAGKIADDERVRLNVPARIWQLRSRLLIHGLGEAIRNRSRRGYFVSAADAAAIKALWDES